MMGSLGLAPSVYDGPPGPASIPPPVGDSEGFFFCMRLRRPLPVERAITSHRRVFAGVLSDGRRDEVCLDPSRVLGCQRVIFRCQVPRV